MDQQTVSKETLIYMLREAICHINRNIYEWRHGKGRNREKFVMSFTEVKGLARNWLIRAFRDKIGPVDADRLFKGVYVNMDEDTYSVKGIALSYEVKGHKMYSLVDEVLSSLNYSQLKYDPKDYLMDGMSDRKPGFDPFFFISFSAIDAIKF